MPGGGSRAGAYVSQIEARHVARRLSQPMTVACGHCGWSTTGTVVVAVDEEHNTPVLPDDHPLELARRHRLEEHGIGPWRRPKRRHKPGTVNLSYIRRNLSGEELDEIETEVARRRRLHGIDA